jgi:hypothetical protein
MTYGELPNIEDDFCLKPTWSNTVAGRSITLTLTRGASGQCLLGGSVYGEAVGPITVTDCKTITASFTLADGTKIDVACKECGCDTGPPDDALECCDKVPCAFCVTYTPYGGDPETVHSEYGSGEWSGTVGGSGFLMYWHRNIYGECEFVVEYDGVKVLEQTIAEGASCDSTSGSVIIGNDVLSWSIVPQTALKRQDAETPFCGACDCVSECLCITITNPLPPDGNGRISRGKLCNSAYECEAPLWTGVIGTHSVSINLEADKVTGGCVLVVEIDGEVNVLGFGACDDIDISFELYDGTQVEITSAKCDDCTPTPDVCCSERSCPYLDSNGSNPYPAFLTVQLSATFLEECTGIPPASGFKCPQESSCYDFSFPIFLSICEEDGAVFYSGIGENTCTWCGVTYSVRILASLSCFGNLRLNFLSGDCIDGREIAGTATERSCDPILVAITMEPCLDCRFQCVVGSIEISPGVNVPIIAIHPPFCIEALIYETP